MSNESTPSGPHLRIVPPFEGSDMVGSVPYATSDDGNPMTEEMHAQYIQMQEYRTNKEKSQFSTEVETEARLLAENERFSNPHPALSVEKYDKLPGILAKITHNPDGSYVGPDGVPLNPSFCQRLYNYAHANWVLSEKSEITLIDTLSAIADSKNNLTDADKLLLIEHNYHVDINTKPNDDNTKPDVATEAEAVAYWKNQLFTRYTLSKELSSRESKEDSQNAQQPKKKQSKKEKQQQDEYVYVEPSEAHTPPAELIKRIESYAERFGRGRYEVPTAYEYTEMLNLRNRIATQDVNGNIVDSIDGVPISPNTAIAFFGVANAGRWVIGQAESKSLSRVLKSNRLGQLSTIVYEDFMNYVDAINPDSEDGTLYNDPHYFELYKSYTRSRLELSRQIQQQRENLLHNSRIHKVGSVAVAMYGNELEMPTTDGVPQLLKQALDAAGESPELHALSTKDLNALSKQEGERQQVDTPQKYPFPKRRNKLAAIRNRSGKNVVRTDSVDQQKLTLAERIRRRIDKVPSVR